MNEQEKRKLENIYLERYEKNTVYVWLIILPQYRQRVAQSST